MITVGIGLTLARYLEKFLVRYSSLTFDLFKAHHNGYFLAFDGCATRQIQYTDNWSTVMRLVLNVPSCWERDQRKFLVIYALILGDRWQENLKHFVAISEDEKGIRNGIDTCSPSE